MSDDSSQAPAPVLQGPKLGSNGSSGKNRRVKKSSCLYCDFSTDISHEIQAHQAKHGQENKFFCSFCNFSSNDKEDTKLHMNKDHLSKGLNDAYFEDTDDVEANKFVDSEASILATTFGSKWAKEVYKDDWSKRLYIPRWYQETAKVVILFTILILKL